MISPLVNPVSGEMTLSRLDSSSSRPAMWTRTRSGILDLLDGLVGTQPHEPGEAQPPVPGHVAVPDLDHQHRPGIERVLSILARDRLGEWRLRDEVRFKPRAQVRFDRGRDAAADPAAVDQAGR